VLNFIALLELTFARYDVAPPAGVSEAQFAPVRKMIQVRLSGVIRRWMTTQPYDFSEDMLNQLKEWSDTKVSKDHSSTAALLLQAVTNIVICRAICYER
jgi:hypothetical protein